MICEVKFLNISYNTVVDYLKEYLSPHFKVKNGFRTFDSFRFLPASKNDFNINHLYFSQLSDLINNDCASEGNMVVVCIDDMDYSTIPKHIRCQLILLAPQESPRTVFNSILDFFASMNEWEREMERAIADRVSIQEVLDISAAFFRKPVFIFDYALRTLAKTGESDSEIMKKLCEDGGIPTPYIQFIIDNGILSKAKQYRELGILKKSSSMPYNLLIKTMTANLLNLDSIVMFCGDDLPTAADIDYMQYFIKMLDRYVDINYNNHSHEKQVNTSQSFFSDCIEGKIISPEEMHRGSLLVGIPYTGRFSLACVRFESFSYSAANFLIKVLETANPFGSVFIYKDEVILINNEQKYLNSEADNETIRSRSEEYLKQFGAKLGISALCYNFFDLHTAYMQATAAVELGSMLEPAKYRYRYRDYFMYHIISCAGKTFGLKHLYTQRLNSLIEYDREHNTDNLQLLETYIVNEYNISKTAEAMHLHRNSVIYRIDKIKTLLGESTWDASFMTNLIVSFYTLRLLRAENTDK